jgi:hypothetical protein
MKIQEVRTLDADDLRQLCIKYKWYTKGNNEEYSNLLYNMASKENLSTNDIVAMAKDIMEHSSNIEHELTSICYEIAKRCIVYFEEV